MGDTTITAKEVEPTEFTAKVAIRQNSPPSDRLPTRKIRVTGRNQGKTSLLRSEWVQVFQNLLRQGEILGVKFSMSDLRPARDGAGIILYGFSICGICGSLFEGEICWNAANHVNTDK